MNDEQADVQQATLNQTLFVLMVFLITSDTNHRCPVWNKLWLAVPVCRRSASQESTWGVHLRRPPEETTWGVHLPEGRFAAVRKWCQFSEHLSLLLLQIFVLQPLPPPMKSCCRFYFCTGRLGLAAVDVLDLCLKLKYLQHLNVETGWTFWLLLHFTEIHI